MALIVYMYLERPNIPNIAIFSRKHNLIINAVENHKIKPSYKHNEHNIHVVNYPKIAFNERKFVVIPK